MPKLQPQVPEGLIHAAFFSVAEKATRYTITASHHVLALLDSLADATSRDNPAPATDGRIQPSPFGAEDIQRLHSQSLADGELIETLTNQLNQTQAADALAWREVREILGGQVNETTAEVARRIVASLNAAESRVRTLEADLAQQRGTIAGLREAAESTNRRLAEAEARAARAELAQWDNLTAYNTADGRRAAAEARIRELERAAAAKPAEDAGFIAPTLSAEDARRLRAWDWLAAWEREMPMSRYYYCTPDGKQLYAGGGDSPERAPGPVELAEALGWTDPGPGAEFELNRQSASKLTDDPSFERPATDGSSDPTTITTAHQTNAAIIATVEQLLTNAGIPAHVRSSRKPGDLIPFSLPERIARLIRLRDEAIDDLHSMERAEEQIHELLTNNGIPATISGPKAREENLALSLWVRVNRLLIAKAELEAKLQPPPSPLQALPPGFRWQLPLNVKPPTILNEAGDSYYLMHDIIAVATRHACAVHGIPVQVARALLQLFDQEENSGSSQSHAQSFEPAGEDADQPPEELPCVEPIAEAKPSAEDESNGPPKGAAKGPRG